MPQINCHIPIKLRISGRPSDEQLDELSEKLVRALTARISFAEQKMIYGQPTTEQQGIEEVRERTEDMRWYEESYAVPSYDKKGRHQRLRVKRPKMCKSLKRICVRGDDTDINVYRLLLRLKKRIKHFQGVTTGRIRGNTLEYGGGKYLLRPITNLEQYETLSSRLKEGVFYIRPLLPSSVDPILRLAGPGYRFYLVDSKGRLNDTGISAVIQGFYSISEGILIYSSRTIYVPEMKVIVRRPRDTEALAKKILETLGEWGHITNPGITVIALLSFLEKEKLTAAEMMEILGFLKGAGRLSDFLNLIQVNNFRDFLRNKGVPWDYVFQNWEPSINDSGLVFAGYMVGVGENFYEAAKLIYMITGSLFSKELANERNQLFAAIKKFFNNPVINAIEGIKQLKDDFIKTLWNLEFFEAGRIVGNVVIVLLTLPSAFRSLPKIARTLAKTTVKLVRLTVQQVRALGVTAKMLRDFLLNPGIRMVTPEGLVIISVGDDVSLMSSAGRPIGRIPNNYIDDVVRHLDDLEKAGRDPLKPKLPKQKRWIVAPKINLDDIVMQAMKDLKEMGVKGLHPTKYGTRLHNAVAKRLAEVASPTNYVISVEKRLSDIFKLSHETAKMTVTEFLKANPYIAEQIGKLPSKTLKSLVGDLVPDLVIRRPDGIYVVWDLTSTTHAEHFYKTILYTLIGSNENVLVQIGETYWRAPKPKTLPGPAATGPSAGAVGKAATKK